MFFRSVGVWERNLGKNGLFCPKKRKKLVYKQITYRPTYLVHPTRFELATLRIGIWYSIQLSYGCIFADTVYSVSALSLVYRFAADIVADTDNRAANTYLPTRFIPYRLCHWFIALLPISTIERRIGIPHYRRGVGGISTPHTNITITAKKTQGK